MAKKRGDVFVNMEDIRVRRDSHGRFNHQNELQYSYDAANGGRVRLKWQWTKKRAGYAWTGAGGDGKFSTVLRVQAQVPHHSQVS